VEVRSKEEILGTLDEKGRLEDLPFMPQMFQFCGQQFSVYKRAHKTCDTVNPIGSRWLSDGIHLDLRCDGKAYGGCQAACLIFWKEAWLKPIDQKERSLESAPDSNARETDETIVEVSCSEEDVWRATRAEDRRPGEEVKYTCQATQLPYFTTPLRWWGIRQYLEDFSSGNVTFGRMFRAFIYAGYAPLCYPRRRNWLWGPPLRWLYDRFQSHWGGAPFPRRTGIIPDGQLTPTSTLGLQPGDMVRVKSYKEILATLDSSNKNRGLSFDAELVPHCGGTYRVRSRVSNFINEKTGKMMTLKTPAVILENVWCRSRYSSCRMFCPRSIYSWWREVWLEKVPEGDHGLSPPCKVGGAQANEVPPHTALQRGTTSS
jgi:hypothetical protein